MPSFQPATIENVYAARRAVDKLKEARAALVAAGANRAIHKVHDAIKSAEDAVQHVEGRYQRTLADPATDPALFPIGVATAAERAEMTERREVAPGLYAARDAAGTLRLFDRENYRGYVSPWPTPAKPDGHKMVTWGPRSDVARNTFTRTYSNASAAERALIIKGSAIQESR